VAISAHAEFAFIGRAGDRRRCAVCGFAALWHFQAGNEIPSSPMSYAVDGKQYVALSSAGVLFSFALPD
jgi:hypothetical protein